MMKILSASRDPVGRAILSDGRVFREIYDEWKKFYLDVLNSETVQNMVGKEIVETTVTTEKIAGYNIVLEHKCISPVSYPYEWPLAMLLDSAVLTLDICIGLCREKWVLKDATPYNVLFDGYQPKWIDYTSIMPEEEDLYWVAYDQFTRTFLFPLLLGSMLNGRVVRSLFLGNQNGISPDEMKSFLPSFSWLKYPWLTKRLFLPLALIDMSRKAEKEEELSKLKQTIQGGAAARQKFFEDIKKDLLSIRLPSISSMWSNYYDDINSFFSPDLYHAKQKAIAGFIEKFKPATVVDIGCNQGGYSIIAALNGAKVVAFDNDEDSISLLYRLVKEKKLNILPLVGDVVYPSPASGWCAREFAPASERFYSEMAFALALVHHLAITQNLYFDRIASMLSEYASKWLVTEFVPLDDPRAQEISRTARRDLSWYTLENFTEALKKEFRKVETYPSFPEGRTLFLCEK